MAKIKIWPHEEICPDGAEIESFPDESICEAALRNNITIDITEINYPGFKQKVSPLQFWKPSKGSIDDIENKLSRLKK